MMPRLLALALLFTGVAAFAPLASVPRHSVQLEAHKRSDSSLGFAKFFGLVAAVSVLSFGDAPSAQAAPHRDDSFDASCPDPFCFLNDAFLAMPPSTAPAFSSSMEIADTIKMLDMSLPSYGDISDAKVSVENTKSLSMEVVVPVTKSEPAASSKSSSDSNLAAAFLPSMSKKSGQVRAQGGNAKEKAAPAPKKESVRVPGYDF